VFVIFLVLVFLKRQKLLARNCTRGNYKSIFSHAIMFSYTTTTIYFGRKRQWSSQFGDNQARR